MLLEIDDFQIHKLERDLKRFTERAFAFATLEALNAAVEGAKVEIVKHLRSRMILRNQWTAGSIQTRKARGLKVDAQAAEVGSMQEYMREQEEGFTRASKRKHGVPVPTSYSAGQGGAKKRTRQVRGAHRLAAIQMGTHKALGNRSDQRNVRSVQEAIKTGKRFVFMKFRTKKGIYKVIGGSRKSKSGWPKGAKLRLVWSLTHKTYNVKAHKWLEPETDKVMLMVPELYHKALVNQLKRQGILTQQGKVVR